MVFWDIEFPKWSTAYRGYTIPSPCFGMAFFLCSENTFSDSRCNLIRQVYLATVEGEVSGRVHCFFPLWFCLNTIVDYREVCRSWRRATFLVRPEGFFPRTRTLNGESNGCHCTKRTGSRKDQQSLHLQRKEPEPPTSQLLLPASDLGAISTSWRP